VIGLLINRINLNNAPEPDLCEENCGINSFEGISVGEWGFRVRSVVRCGKKKAHMDCGDLQISFAEGFVISRWK
jgi:hypothetical protein